jgi:drug/metabolite transporter (DMT)-like permease
MAAFGAGLGPVAFAWGMQHTAATSGALMLTLEAVFTALMARLWYGEPIGRRVGVALALLTAGGMLLVLDRSEIGGGALGLLAVAVATWAWGVDNALSRPLAERDPGQVVMIKGALGATATALLSWGFGEPLPSAAPALGLVLVGASGYGLSLRFYLLAQRAFGVTRTGSVFAFAPFIGALLAVALGDRQGGVWLWGGCGLMLAGIALHITERHAHAHLHEALDHEHAHRHDDGHHGHAHGSSGAALAAGDLHSHRHRHLPTRHTHPHVPDEHHQHTH